MGVFENEYYLLKPTSIENFPLVVEECKRHPFCPVQGNFYCDTDSACPALTNKLVKIDDPQPIFLDFFTALTKKEVIYADCYVNLSLFRFSFVVSPKLYNILNNMNIEGIQLIPVILFEHSFVKYVDFWYVHIYNILPVLSFENSRYQEINGLILHNNLLQIKFNTKKMKAIPLENRLIFRFPLDRSYFMFHVSVVDKIMSVNPIGFQFIKISNINLPNSNKLFF